MKAEIGLGKKPEQKAISILGISAFYHDSAACFVRDGRIIAASQEERFTRKKHDASFPKHAADYCLREAGTAIDGVDFVAFYEKPFIKFDRILHTYLSCAPAGIQSFLKAIPLWIKEKIWMKDLIRKELNYDGRIFFSEHHESHEAYAFYPPSLQKDPFLTVTSFGEWSTTSFGIERGNQN